MKGFENLFLGCWISILDRYGQNFMHSRLKDEGIPKGHHLFLVALFEKEGVSQEELAKNLNVDKGSVARALRRLEEKGWITRQSDESDRRSNKVFLTDKARALKTKIHFSLNEWANILSRGFSEEEYELILGLLKKMYHNARNIQKER